MGWSSDYLRILGVPEEKPSVAYLKTLCQAHLETFPFENISKLTLDRKRWFHPTRFPDVPFFLENRHSLGMGGTCYALNGATFQLLKFLGFACHLVQVGRSHMAIAVALEEWGDEYALVDVGSAAPFFAPVRVEKETGAAIRFGSDEIRFKKVGEKPKRFQYIRFDRGQRMESDWIFDIREVATFSQIFPAVERSYEPEELFMTSIRCQLWQLELKRSVSIKNARFRIRYADGSEKTYRLSSVKEMERVLADEFDLPRLPVGEAVEHLMRKGIDIFQDHS